MPTNPIITSLGQIECQEWLPITKERFYTDNLVGWKLLPGSLIGRVRTPLAVSNALELTVLNEAEALQGKSRWLNRFYAQGVRSLKGLFELETQNADYLWLEREHPEALRQLLAILELAISVLPHARLLANAFGYKYPVIVNAEAESKVINCVDEMVAAMPIRPRVGITIALVYGTRTGVGAPRLEAGHLCNYNMSSIDAMEARGLDFLRVPTNDKQLKAALAGIVF